MYVDAPQNDEELNPGIAKDIFDKLIEYSADEQRLILEKVSSELLNYHNNRVEEAEKELNEKIRLKNVFQGLPIKETPVTN